MLYSTRHIWRIAIALLLIAVIAPRIPNAIRDAIQTSIGHYILHFLDILRI